MAFLEERLDSRIERGAQGGPVNRGRVKTYTVSGKLAQTFDWSAPLQEWDVSHGLRSVADFEALRALWHVVMFTPYSGFRFRDWSDYIATQANTTLSLISGSDYQLKRAYTFRGITYARKITKPTAGAIVYRTRASVVTVATATVDTTTGVATIIGHTSGDTYTWEGQFDVPVTFAGNDLPTQLESGADGPLIITQPIKLEEVRL
jgi:uncharacterized protein (TIGR02217 family)